MHFVEIVVPLAVSGTFHYMLPNSGRSSTSLVGCRATVSFGRRRLYTGIITSVSSSLPEALGERQVKTVESIIDTKPIIPQHQLDLWRWIADYYHCPLGTVLGAVMPKGLLPESKTLIYLNNEWTPQQPLAQEELTFLDVISIHRGRGLPLNVLEQTLGKVCHKTYLRLLALGAIHTEEAIVSRYRPKKVAYIQLENKYQSEEGLNTAFSLLKRAKRQSELLSEFVFLLQEQGPNWDVCLPLKVLSQSEPKRLALIRKIEQSGIWQILFKEETYPASEAAANSPRINNKVSASISSKDLNQSVNYLYTEDAELRKTYILELVREQTQLGGQVLLLSPSARATPSEEAYLQALRQASQGYLYTYHSGISETERIRLYQHLALQDEPCLVMGTRSAVFLPLRKLSLIIIEDEHEYLYKRQYSIPAIHARDVALFLASSMGVRVLLSSATPSSESWFNILRGKYSLIPLQNTSPSIQSMLQVEVIDLSKHTFNSHSQTPSSISPKLYTAMQEELLSGHRILVIGNRRGYAPYVVCTTCHQGIRCPHCDISLSYSSIRQLYICSRCNYKEPSLLVCRHCGAEGTRGIAQDQASALRFVGYGTERLAEELGHLFPDARLMQLDSDTLQTAKERNNTIERIQAGDVDIIVGTSLIKGQPIWDNIGLIAVVHLDAILSYPDFRSGERTFQLLTQLQLRSQRVQDGKFAKVILQTSNPSNPFLAYYKQGDYLHYIKQELTQRKHYAWAPFTRVSYIRLRGLDVSLLSHATVTLYRTLLHLLGASWVSYSEDAPPARFKGQPYREIICRRPYNKPYRKEREAWKIAHAELLKAIPSAQKIQITYNVDPL